MNISPLQPFKTQMEFDRFFATEEACINFFVNLRWQGKPKCPKCEHDAGSFSDGKRFKCRNNQCNKVFSYKVGTIFENSKIRMNEWFKAIYLMLRSSVSSRKLPEDIGITQPSAWFALHRLRHAVDQDRTPLLLGMHKQVKGDEGTFGGANPNKHVHKQIPGTQGRSARGKIIFLGACESDGDAVLKVVFNTSTHTIQPFLNQFVRKGAYFTSDEWTGYANAHKSLIHNQVNHGAKQYVNGKWHSNDMENFFLHFFLMLKSTYIQLSSQHAQAYADFFVHCWNNRKVSTACSFIVFLIKTIGCRLTYRELVRRKDSKLADLQLVHKKAS